MAVDLDAGSCSKAYWLSFITNSSLDTLLSVHTSCKLVQSASFLLTLQKSGKAKKVETAEEKEERLRLEAIEAAEHGAKLEKATAARLSERRAREQEYAHLNALKIQNQWRSIMRQVRPYCPVLHKQL